MNQKDLVSFFAIGGIHGLPYEPWDNAFGVTTQKAGYCTHGSNLFPTWHRAYVALFEVCCVFSVISQKSNTITFSKSFRNVRWR